MRRHTPCAARLLGMVTLAAAMLVGLPIASAREDDRSVYARVMIEAAALRTGPGASFRLVRVAHRGDSFVVRERATRGYWLHVELPDGTLAYVQGDAVYIQEPEAGEGRLRRAIFAPAPLLSARGELSFTLGMLSGSGLLALRPALLLSPHVGFEANLAASVGGEGRIFIGGLGALFNIFPEWPVVPFVAGGGGAAYASPNADTFILEPGARSTVYAGGGLRFGFRRRLILRVEGRSYALFNANGLRSQQEVSFGLSAFF